MRVNAGHHVIFVSQVRPHRLDSAVYTLLILNPKTFPFILEVFKYFKSIKLPKEIDVNCL